jgi:uncharacterized protein (DUF2267 family)
MAVLTYEAFIATVRRAAHIPSEEAERAACATLQTLSERISAGETEDVAGRLPEQLRSCLSAGEAQDPFHADEFLRRVAERAGLDEPAAQRDARAVFSTLFRAVGPEEFHDLRSELPDDFDPLLDEALRDASTLATAETEAKPGVSADEFVGRVADRLDIDRERARGAVEAVLEVLAIRISGGEVRDLAARLPPELRPALQRGLSESALHATALSLDDFLRAIAHRERVSVEDAAAHVRAVLTTLREAVGEQEFDDMASQLPDEYAPLLRYQG